MKTQTETAGSKLLSKKLETLVPEKRGGQKELARRLGKTQDLISRWANGWREPSKKDAARLEDELFIPIRAWAEGVDRLSYWENVSAEMEATAEPRATFPADAGPANGDAGHAA